MRDASKLYTFGKFDTVCVFLITILAMLGPPGSVNYNLLSTLSLFMEMLLNFS